MYVYASISLIQIWYHRITCASQCCDVDNCNNPFPVGGGEVNSSNRPMTVQAQVTNGGQSTEGSMDLSTASRVNSTPKTALTTTNASSSEEESTLATTQLSDVPSTADQTTATTTLLATTEESRENTDLELSRKTATTTFLVTTEKGREDIDSELSGETATITRFATMKEDGENIDFLSRNLIQSTFNHI